MKKEKITEQEKQEAERKAFAAFTNLLLNNPDWYDFRRNLII